MYSERVMHPARPPPARLGSSPIRSTGIHSQSGDKEMRTAIKRRLALPGATTATLVAVTTLVTGETFGQFSASVTGEKTAVTGATIPPTKTPGTLPTPA